MTENPMKDAGFSKVNGVTVPGFVTQEAVDKLKSFKLYPDDVWVVTYPKCGTTWTQQIVRLIINKGVQDNIKVTTAVPWLEAEKFIPDLNVDKMARPRAFKTHFSYDLLPCGPAHATPCKYIYVTRNPKDSAVSGFHHLKKVYLPDIEWDAFWEKFISGDGLYGDYFDHLLSWLPHKDDENVLFMKYEDMKKDLNNAVSKIASFMGVSLPSDVIAKITDLCSAENMRKDDTANMSWMKEFCDEDGKSIFVRKGVVGDWKNLLSSEQSAQMDTIYAKKLEGTGFELDFE